MKRQHPTDPNLFRCTKCLTYKKKEEFHIDKRRMSPKSICKKCHNKEPNGKNHNKSSRSSYARNKEVWAERRKEYSLAHRHETNERQNKRRKFHPEKVQEYNRRIRKNLTDYYVSHCLKRHNKPVTPQIIELKRQQIIAKRTLNEFKQWRKENEK
jgi:hypothetical protein